MGPVGVVACETLHPEIETLRQDADVRYVPQEYHEFPASDPLDEEITERVQAGVDALDGPARERIAVSYATSSDGLRGVRSSNAPLVVSRADDCVSLLVYGVESGATDRHKQSGTYYLTRGWIDCGVDCYKLYKAYRGEEDDLLARFADAPGDRRATWAEGDRYRRAVDRGQSMSAGTVGRFFHRIGRHFERVVLVDTGHLDPFDREYAESFRSFLEALNAEHGDGGAVELSTVEGDPAALEALLTCGVSEARASAFLDVYPAGTPVE